MMKKVLALAVLMAVGSMAHAESFVNIKQPYPYPISNTEVNSGSTSVSNSAGGVGYGGSGGQGGVGMGGSAASTGNQSTTTGNSLVIEGGPANTTAQITQTIQGTQTQNVVYSGTQTIKNVPSMAAPNLATSNDTCMGSTSGGLAVPGFGASLGGNWVDPNCKMLKNSRELWNMGMKAAALALMCSDEQNREAIEMSATSAEEFVCPQTRKARAQAAATSGHVIHTSADTSDPYIKRRMENQ